MAFPELRAVGAIAASTGAITPGGPSGAADCDLELLFTESGGASAEGEATPSLTNLLWKPIPAAWGGPIAVQNGNTKLTVLYKWVPAVETRRGPTNDTGDHQMGRIIGLKAGTFDPERPIDSIKTSTQASTTAVSITGVTPSVAECLIIAASAGNLPDATGTTQFASVANAKLGSVTERIDNTTAEGDGGALFVATGTLAGASESGATTVTASNAALRANATIAIRPFKAPERPYQVGASTVVLFGSRAALEFAKPTGETGDYAYIWIYSTKKAKLPTGGVFESEGQATGGPFRDELIRIPYAELPATLKIEWEGGGSAECVGEMQIIRNNDPSKNIVGKFKTEASKTVKLEALTSTFKNGLARAWAANTSGTSPGGEPGGESGMWWERVRYSPAVFEKSMPGEEATGAIEWELGGVSVTWAGNSIILAPVSKTEPANLTMATGGVATAALALTAPTQVPLAPVAGVGSAAAALTAPTRIPLGAAAGVGSAALAITAPTQIPLAPVAGVGSAALKVSAPTQVPLQAAAGVASASLALSAPTLVALGASAGVGAASVALSAPTVIPLGVASGVGLAALALSTGSVPVIAIAAAGVGAAALKLTAPTIVPLGAAAGIGSAALALSAPTYLALASAGAGSAVLLFSVPTQVPLGAVHGVGAAALALNAPTRLILAPVAGIGSAAAALFAPTRLVLAPTGGVGSAALVLTAPAQLQLAAAGIANAALALKTAAALQLSAEGVADAELTFTTPVLLALASEGEGTAFLALTVATRLTRIGTAATETELVGSTSIEVVAASGAPTVASGRAAVGGGSAAALTVVTGPSAILDTEP